MYDKLEIAMGRISYVQKMDKLKKTEIIVDNLNNYLFLVKKMITAL